MGYVVVVETAEHVDYGIGFADVCEKFVAEAFAFRGSFDKAGDIYYLDRRGHYGARIAHFHELVEAFVGYGYHAHIRLYGAEWEIGRLCLGVRQTIEKC